MKRTSTILTQEVTGLSILSGMIVTRRFTTDEPLTAKTRRGFREIGMSG